jgi:ATP-dependent Lon protease
VLPIRNAVLFPGAVAPFDVGREKSVALVEDIDNLPGPSSRSSRSAIPPRTIPGEEDLYPVGVRGARAEGAQALERQLLAHPAGPHAHPLDT